MLSPAIAMLPMAALLSPIAEPQPMPPPTGKIVFYRTSSIVGASVDCLIRYQGREVVDLNRGEHAEWEVPVGYYNFSTKTNNLQVTVDPGQTRYVRCNIKMGLLSGRPDLEKSDALSYGKHAADYQRTPIMFGPVSPPTN